MPLTNFVTVTGSTAAFDIHASGSGFGIFSSYSAFASEAFSFNGTTTSGTGTVGLTLDTPYGDLVFTGTDTIGATASSYTVVGSEKLSFVFGSDTLDTLSGTYSFSGTTFTQLGGDLNAFYQDVKPILALADSTAGAAAADLKTDVEIIFTAGTPSVPGGSGASVTQNGIHFNFTKLG